MADKWTNEDEYLLRVAQSDAANLEERKRRIESANLAPLLEFCRAKIADACFRDMSADGVVSRMAAHAKKLRELLAPFEQ